MKTNTKLTFIRELDKNGALTEGPSALGVTTSVGEVGGASFWIVCLSWLSLVRLLFGVYFGGRRNLPAEEEAASSLDYAGCKNGSFLWLLEFW